MHNHLAGNSISKNKLWFKLALKDNNFRIPKNFYLNLIRLVQVVLYYNHLVQHQKWKLWQNLLPFSNQLVQYQVQLKDNNLWLDLLLTYNL